MAFINASPADDDVPDPITESLSVGVVRIDAAGAVTLLNGAFARMTAVDGAARGGRTLEHAIGAVNAAELQPLIDGAFAGHRSGGERRCDRPTASTTSTRRSHRSGRATTGSSPRSVR